MGAMGRWQGVASISGGGGVNLCAVLPADKGGLLVFAWNLLGYGLNDVLNTRTR